MSFQMELALVLNRYIAKEKDGVNTPDGVLARYLKDCLDVGRHAVAEHEDRGVVAEERERGRAT